MKAAQFLVLCLLLAAAIPARAEFSVPPLYQGTREAAESLEEVREALKDDPDDWLLITAVEMDKINRAIGGQTELIEPAREGLERLMKIYPEHPIAPAYHALTWCLEARDTWIPWKAYSKVKECRKRLDALVAEHPEHYPYRATRGQAYAQLPQSIFDSYQTAREDLRWIMQTWDDRTRYVNPKAYADSLVLLAKIEAEEDNDAEAIRLLRMALGVAKGFADEATIRGFLAEMGVDDPQPIPPKVPHVKRPASLDEARTLWEARLAANPDDPRALQLTAQLDYFDAMAFDAEAAFRARDRLLKAHRLEPDNIVIETYLATAVGITGDYVYYGGHAYALAALAHYRARQVEKKTGGNLGYILTSALGTMYASSPDVLFHTRKKAETYYRRMTSEYPDKATLEKEVHAIYGDEQWHADTLVYLLRTMKSGGRRPIETKFILAMTMGLTPVATERDFERSRAEVEAILEARPEEAPKELRDLAQWLKNAPPGAKIRPD